MAIYRPSVEHERLSGTDEGLLEAVAHGAARLTAAQALEAFHGLPLQTLGRFADARARALHGDDLRTYIIDRNINYTNVCNARCTFCAFRRDAGDADAYTLEAPAILEKIAELEAIGGTQILMQGGMNPALPLEWYEDLLRTIKAKHPKIHVHAFSPPEFIEFVHFFDPPGETLEAKLRYVMTRLRAAGLDSIPGGGGEIFAHHVRRKIGLGKCDAEAWLTCMYVAHTLGMFTSATMMFGHIEGYADRVHHMGLVRSWQDRALIAAGEAGEPVGHYKAFISWPFQRENTPLGRVKEWGLEAEDREAGAEFPGDVVARLPEGLSNEEVIERVPRFGRRVRMSSATDYLRTQALSRLFLDNVYSIGASWVTMGPHIGQVALAYGANDMGSVMMEENVVSSAGTTYCLDEAVLCRLIRGAGFTPAQRNNTYDIVRVHAGAGSPDLSVTDWSTHRARKMHQQAPRGAAGGKPGKQGAAEVVVPTVSVHGGGRN
ncbi:MAG TPA: radical SAM protein [Phycisphaerales bacterium]|nr:radical SAM protein [Phycisphaerales bacterium]